MINYAQLNENNIVTSVSQLSGEVNKPDMIKTEFYDITMVGKKYVDGEFVELTEEERKEFYGDIS